MSDEQKLTHYNSNRIQVRMMTTEILSTLVAELTVMELPFRASSTIRYDPTLNTPKTLINTIEIMKLDDAQTVRVADLLKQYKLEYMLSLNSVHSVKED